MLAGSPRLPGGSMPRGIVYEEIDEYIDGLANRGDAALMAVEKQGMDEGWPIVGPAEGSLLHILARSAETAAIRTYNERLAKDPRMIAAIVPLRDGVSIASKIHD